MNTRIFWNKILGIRIRDGMYNIWRAREDCAGGHIVFYDVDSVYQHALLTEVFFGQLFRYFIQSFE